MTSVPTVRRPIVRAATLLVGLLLGLPAGSARADLSSDLATVLHRLSTAQAPAIANLGIVVVEPGSGSVVFEQQADAPMAPASTLKLVTSAAALQLLGPQYRFPTVLAATGSIKNGLLAGDLVLAGSGDPTFTSDDMRDMVTDLKAQGVQAIEGNLVVDATAIATPSWEPGWMVDDLQETYAPLVTGLSVDGGVETVGASPSVVTRPSLNPPMAAGDTMRQKLEQAGVTLKGRVVSGRRAGGDRVLVEHDSAPLVTLLSPMNKASLNLWAEALFRAMGTLNDPAAGTAEAGSRAILSYLDSVGISPADVRIADGSGLSRYDLVTPRTLARVLRAALGGVSSLAFRTSLPLAGVDGTLTNRFVNSPLQGKFYAKTGTMSGICCLAGYLEDVRGRRWIVVMMANGYVGPAKPVQALLDSFVEALWRGLATSGNE